MSGEVSESTAIDSGLDASAVEPMRLEIPGKSQEGSGVHDAERRQQSGRRRLDETEIERARIADPSDFAVLLVFLVVFVCRRSLPEERRRFRIRQRALGSLVHNRPASAAPFRRKQQQRSQQQQFRH